MPAPADGYERTHVGNARRLRDHLGGRVLFSPATGFYLWNGRVWEPDAYAQVRAALHDVTDDLINEGRYYEEHAAKKDDREEAEAAVAWGLRSQHRTNLDSALSELSMLPGVRVDADEMDKNAHLLTVANGTVDLRDGTLREHDPEDRISKMVDVNYDPHAGAPRWTRFLTEVFPGDEEMPHFLQRLIGYGVTGSTAEQCFAVFYGGGSNGKSVAVETLRRVMPAITRTAQFSSFESNKNTGVPTDIAATHGARLLFATEGDALKGMNEQLLKQVTGGDSVTARHLYRAQFTFKPEFLLVLSTNSRPNFRGQDEGLWRRVMLVEWARYFAPEEREEGLQDTLAGEAEGILAWAVRGAIRYYTHGLQPPERVRADTQQYREEEDALAGFLPGVLVHDSGASENGQQVYDAYRSWALEAGIQPKNVWTRATFYRALEERKISRKRTTRGQELLGIRFAVPGETPEAGEPSPIPNVRGESGRPSLAAVAGDGAA